VRLLRKHPDTFTLPGFLPAVLLAGLAAGPLCGWWGGALAATWLGGAAAYALAVLAFSVALGGREREPALVPLFPFVFLAIHLGAGAGQWTEALTRRRNKRTTIQIAPGDKDGTDYRAAA
jgi:hypothetical protein